MKRKDPSLAKRTCSVIPFVNREGHTIRLNESMTLRELVKMGIMEIHISKPETPLREGEYRDASPT